MALTQLQAQSAICSWKQGVFPANAIDQLTVGRETETRAVQRALAVAADSGSGGLFFEAEYGHGKSHMLRLVEATALAEGFAVSWLAFDHKSHAFNHPTRYFHSLLKNLRVPGYQGRGFARIIEDALNDDRRPAVLDYAKSAPYFIRSTVYQLSLGGLSEEMRDAAFRVLECRDLQAKNGIYHYPEVYARFQAVATLLQAMGLKGVVWLFDEVECLTKLTNCQSRFAGYSLLHHFLESGRFPHSWFFLATTGDFRERLRGEKNPYGRYDGAPQFVQDWREGSCAVHTLRKLKPEQKLRLLHSVRQVHAIAFAWQPDHQVTDDFLARYLEQTQKAGLTEREMLKSMVTVLEVCEQYRQCNPMLELFGAEQKTASMQNVA